MAEPRRRTAAPQRLPPFAPAAAPASTLRRRTPLAQQPGMVRTTYEDEDGWRWIVLVPAGREEDAAYGVVLGPPDVRAALPDLPDAIARRLHDELLARELLTANDLRGRGPELQAALQAALRLDVAALQAAFHQENNTVE